MGFSPSAEIPLTKSKEINTEAAHQASTALSPCNTKQITASLSAPFQLPDLPRGFISAIKSRRMSPPKLYASTTKETFPVHRPQPRSKPTFKSLEAASRLCLAD
jgi:hypothetical protein